MTRFLTFLLLTITFPALGAQDDFEASLLATSVKSAVLQENWEAALTDLDALTGLSPDSVEPHFLKGRTHYELWKSGGGSAHRSAATTALRSYAERAGRRAPNYDYALDLIMEIETAAPDIPDTAKASDLQSAQAELESRVRALSHTSSAEDLGDVLALANELESLGRLRKPKTPDGLGPLQMTDKQRKVLDKAHKQYAKRARERGLPSMQQHAEIKRATERFAKANQLGTGYVDYQFEIKHKGGKTSYKGRAVVDDKPAAKRINQQAPETRVPARLTAEHRQALDAIQFYVGQTSVDGGFIKARRAIEDATLDYAADNRLPRGLIPYAVSVRTSPKSTQRFSGDVYHDPDTPRHWQPRMPVRFTDFVTLDDLLLSTGAGLAIAPKPLPGRYTVVDQQLAPLNLEIDKQRQVALLDKQIAREQRKFAALRAYRDEQDRLRAKELAERQAREQEKRRRNQNEGKMVGVLLGAATGMAAKDMGASTADAFRVASNMNGMVQGDQAAYQDMQAHKAEVQANTDRLRQLNQQRAAATGSGAYGTTAAASPGVSTTACAHGPVQPMRMTGVCAGYNQGNYMSMNLVGDATVDRLCANAVNNYDMYRNNVCDARATAAAVARVYDRHLAEVARANDLWNNHRGSQGLGDVTGRPAGVVTDDIPGWDPESPVNDPTPCVKTSDKGDCNIER